MPINVQRIGTGSEEKLIIEVTNGDLRAFDNAKQKWRFNSLKSFLEFALAIFSTEGMEVYLNQSGDKTRVKPADELVEPSHTN